ncbi:conserved hypothetical protein [Aspergillus terreus NIH2624]|uniref:Xylanolytic transcriptional activator regulatory domain-containing protein n=1 Tax=Aspergillus terreus (strain NIH 2624 / FGSC A1156) TaxID=341663 RepID=Q0CMR6_ASPTN|nr:uncharacterized protein ATEG_05018 [Aspergillus terreus NIH2624]EAU34087.1 conserved hypothetical protein [Aspergillus terreus NIH2624]
MLETETPHDLPPIVEPSLHPSQIHALLRSYRIAINGFIYLLSDSRPEDVNSHRPATVNSRTQSALRDIKIAIGAQSTQNDPTTIQVERYFFARGQRVAFAGMIETPSLELVKLFLLMAFYMMGACRRNAAFMYLGVAARAAVALGLHLKDSKAGTIEEQRERTCVWMSLCTLDLMSSSILGRPPATANIRSEYNERLGEMEEPPGAMEERLLASYRMSQILDEIIVRLYGETAASADTAESLLAKLNEWSNSLPKSVLSSPSADTEPHTAQAHIVGSLHIACSYHFAVIIVSRPFLISSLGVRLARMCNSPGENESLLQEDAAHVKLANACTDSALYMMQTCMEVYHSGLLLGNMCILKAFVFAAALVLGFSLFSQKDTDTAVEQAFHGALEILRTLAQQSAQASHYYEILSSLKNAIAEQRQRLMQYAPQNKNRYVSKLFSLNSDRPLANPTRFSMENDDLLPATPNILDAWASMDPAEQDPAFSGWEGMELPLWDSFPFIDGSLPVSNRSSESNPAL